MLNKLLTSDLIGGWVTKLIESIEKNNGTHYYTYNIFQNFNILLNYKEK